MVSLVAVEESKVAHVETYMTHASTPLSTKYRILFWLRNVQGSRAHHAMLKGALD
jgi:hypothetical protein